MARTLVGRLQLIVQAMGLNEAKKVEGTISSIERAAKRLSSAQWGVGFQRQIEKMALGARDLDAVRRSWGNLQRDLAAKNLNAALKKSEISAWKTATIGNLAAVRSQMQTTERRAQSLARSLKSLVRPAYIMAGGYTGSYMAGMLGREALSAASEARRVQAEAKFAGLSSEERGKIDTRANDLSGRYRLEKSQVYDLLKEASLSMPSTDSALAVSDEMARAYLIFSNMFGPDGAINGLRQFNKALDNIEMITPEEYKFAIENYAKAQQVIGKDMDPSGFAEAIKMSRTGGKVFSPEFLFRWLPMLIAESGGPDSGTQLRAAFDQFIVGRASKQSLAAQKRYGVRGADGKLVGEDAFGQNPLTWIYDTLLPQLEKQGIGKDNEVELARVIGELTNNRLSSDLVTRAILSFESYRRGVQDRMPNAAGLSAADDVQNLNPLAAWAGFKDSLKNVADAVLPMETVGAGLNRFADYINSFAKKVREGDSTLLGVGGVTAAGVGAFGAYKATAAVYGLITAGTNLNIAAAALQAAAVSQGGVGVLGGAAGGAVGKRGLVGLLTNPWVLAAVVASGGLYKFIADTTASNAKDSKAPPPKYYSQGSDQDRDNYHRLYGGIQFEGGWHRVGRGAAPAPGVEAAKQAGAEMKDALSVKAMPMVDPSSIMVALEAAKALYSMLMQAGSAASRVNSNVESELRRSYSDYGVRP